MTTAALIVAAGRGTRAGGDVAKQWQPLAGRKMIEHTIDAFRRAPMIDRIVLVLHPDDMATGAHLARDGLILTAGGADRAASVRAGLDALAARPPDTVLIHDAARPCVSQALIARVCEALATARAAAPAIPVGDALWTGAYGQVTGTRNRTGLFRAQTPQGFDFDTIRRAHAAHLGGAADDVEVARAFGVEVAIVQGEPDNLKVTVPGDFARAARILGDPMDIRLGNGFDVHRFGPGDHVTLCGVRLDHGRALVGHSDADVGMHALSDAIYGALARGDIGQHFPPSDARWKGAASDIFLRHAAELASEMGYRIANADVTLICEEPKIGPHAADMRAALAAILGVDSGAVSVKATTSEGLGFTGRGEGIAAMATATLVRA